MQFESMKAIEAAAVIARCEGKRLSRMRLLKLLYISERRLAKEAARRLINDTLVAMKNGPLHSTVYDMIKGTASASASWSRYFTNINPRDVELTREPKLHLLSRLEIQTLQDVVSDFVTMDDWSLSDFTHSFDEWKTSYMEGTSTTIKYRKMLDAVGRNHEIIDDIKEDQAFTEFFEQELD